MVATRKTCFEHFVVCQEIWSSCKVHGLLTLYENEFIIYKSWLKDYRLSKSQVLNLNITFWISPTFSICFYIIIEQKALTLMASDDFWEVKENGEKWAKDGMWYWYSTKSKLAKPLNPKFTLLQYHNNFQKLVKQFGGSQQIEVNAYLLDENEELID